MTVNPGFGGQSFIQESYNKISELRKLIDKSGYNTLIEVDGGIDTTNSAKLIDTGVNVLVAGNSVFSSDDPEETIRRLKRPSALAASPGFDCLKILDIISPAPVQP